MADVRKPRWMTRGEWMLLHVLVYGVTMPVFFCLGVLLGEWVRHG